MLAVDMNVLLPYSLSDDQEIFRSDTLGLGEYKVRVSACTVSGKRYVDSARKPNEDAFCVMTQNDTLVAAVFDGASSLKPIHALGDETGARFASHFLKSEMERMEKYSKPETIIRDLHKALLAKTLTFEGTALEDVHTLPASTATIVQLDLQKQVVRMSHVGDSYCIIYYRDGTSSVVTIDKNREQDERLLGLMKNISEERGITPREARQDERVKQALLDMFQDTFNRADGTGQGIINGDPNVEQYLQDLTMPMHPIKAILLGSDGLVPPGMDEQRESDRIRILEVLGKDGLEGLVSTKCSIEDSDPDWHFVRFKHSDDATGVFIQLE